MNSQQFQLPFSEIRPLPAEPEPPGVEPGQAGPIETWFATVPGSDRDTIRRILLAQPAAVALPDRWLRYFTAWAGM